MGRYALESLTQPGFTWFCRPPGGFTDTSRDQRKRQNEPYQGTSVPAAFRRFPFYSANLSHFSDYTQF